MAEVQEAAESAPGTVIPQTKLRVPPVREGLIARQRLVDLLVDGASRRLVLLDAPAGFGKTSLLAEWSASPHETRPFAWVSLDAEDNDPVRFWASVTGSLRAVAPSVADAVQGALETPSVGLLDVALPLLVNEMSALRRPVVVILDDYHLIRSERVHESVSYLVEHLPEAVQLVVSTRADPPLPLGRMRAGGEMLELRAEQLRLSDEEAAGLLAAATGLEFDAADVARLQERTEGWAAGLYLAALSLRGRGDVRAFIDSFTGDDRQIVDYLSSEVLAGQSEEVRSFLLRTSILERLCGPLCDAVTESTGSQETLERIERFNLFVIPLDTTREWYRYHNLFGELLRQQLRRADPEGLPGLHRRASAWFAARGLVAEAIEHANAGGDPGSARELIARHWNGFFNEGRLETVSAWLEEGEEDPTRDPRLCVAGAWLALDRGRTDEAARWLVAAESGVADGGAAGREHQAEAAVLRAVHSFKVADLAQASEAARRALALEPAAGSFPGFVARCMLGITAYWNGEGAAALSALREAAALAASSVNDLGEGYALGYMALVHVGLGELAEAERLAEQALGLSEDPGFTEHFVTAMGHLALGRAEVMLGRLDEAEANLSRGLERARRGAGRLELAATLIGLAEVLQLQGAIAESRAHVREARELLAQCPDPGILERTLVATERGVRAAERLKTPLPAPLTDRENAVLRMLEGPLSRREIAEALYVSLDTVKTHIRGIYRKLAVSTRDEAVSRARDLGLI